MTREAELREDAERGRRYRIAAEVLNEFLDANREKIIRGIEDNPMEDCTIPPKVMELRIMKKFRYVCKHLIEKGELAEEELSRNGE